MINYAMFIIVSAQSELTAVWENWNLFMKNTSSVKEATMRVVESWKEVTKYIRE